MLFLLLQVSAAPVPTPTPRLVGAAATPIAVNRDLGAAARSIRINKTALLGYNPPPQSQPDPTLPALPPQRSGRIQQGTPDTASPTPDEAQWRARIESANQDLIRAEAEAQRAQERFTSVSTCPRTPGAAVEAQRKRLEQAERRLAEAQERVANLPEEARRAGVPPGWLR